MTWLRRPFRTEQDSYPSRVRSGVRHRRAPVPPVRQRRARPVPTTTGPKPRPVLPSRTKAPRSASNRTAAGVQARPRAGLGLDCGAQTGLRERENRQLHDSDRHRESSGAKATPPSTFASVCSSENNAVRRRSVGAFARPTSAVRSRSSWTDPRCSPVSFARASTRDSRKVGPWATVRPPDLTRELLSDRQSVYEFEGCRQWPARSIAAGHAVRREAFLDAALTPDPDEGLRAR